MDRRLIDALSAHPGIHDWSARVQRGSGAQLYLAGGATESLRQVSREAYEVEVFNDHEADGEPRRGSARIPIGREDLERLPAILDDAVTMASLVHNPPWHLAEPREHPPVEIADPAIRSVDDAVAAAADAADAIRSGISNRRDGVRLSAAELFLTIVDEELRTSRGMEAAATSNRVMFELTLLADGADEAEYFRQAQVRRLADLDLANLVADGAIAARDAADARPARTRLGPVVVSGVALEQVMSGDVFGLAGAYLAQTGARAAYLHLSRFEIGEPTYLGRERTGDPLTLRSNALRPHAPLSYAFDEDGLPGQQLLLIEDGVLVARTASQRYAEYLGIPASGRPGVAELAPGPTPMATLLTDGGPVTHVVAFSGPNVDALSGNLGMEIRLGYEITRGGRHPVKGGSVTGNLFEAMAAARFSRETAEHGSVVGPAAIRFEAMQVSGED